MFSPAAKTITGLEIGTSKVCAVVGEMSDDGVLSIVGLGQAKSRGVRKGEIVDAALAVEDIRDAIVEAEQMADVEVRSVYLGVTGPHIRGFNNRGFHPVASVDREISEEDGEDALKNAKTVNLPAENRMIHLMRQHFIVDGQEDIPNPVGMTGARVEVDVHFVHGILTRLQTPIRAVGQLQLEVEDIVFNGIASALAILNSQQKELGSLVIDLGGGTADYVVYSRGVIKHSAVLAVGGDHVTNDLACGLKIPLGRAEELKIQHGAALMDERARGRTVPISNEVGLPERHLSLENLRRIMHLRLEEIFEIIAHDLEAHGMFDHIRDGVVLSGGGSHIPEIRALASRVFGRPVHIGKAGAVSGVKSALDQPEFSTAIGLVRYGSFEWKKRHGSRVGGVRGRISRLFRISNSQE